MDSEAQEKVASHFWALASQIRLDILNHLQDENLKLSDLAKKCNVTSQEIHRNVDKLYKIGWVQKDPEKYYHLSTVGEATLQQIPHMRFFSNHKDYFNEHNFGDIPIGFVQRMGVFKNCTLIKNVTSVLEKWTKIYEDAEEHILAITKEIPYDLLNLACKKMDKGIKLCNIVTEDTIIAKEKDDELKKLGYYNCIKDKSIERKLKDRIQTSIILNKNEGMVIFPTKTGEPDLRYAFYDNTEHFMDWCLDYWRYSWATAKTM